MSTIITLFYEFFLIGLFTFGGGYAMIPLIKEVVIKHGWMDDSMFLNMIGLSEVTPGPIAINMATFVGSSVFQNKGVGMQILGSLVATLAVILPAFIIMLLISIILKRIIKNKYVQGALSGIRPIAIALIFTTALSIVVEVLFPYNSGNNTLVFNRTALSIFLLVVFTSFVIKHISNKKVSPIHIIIISAILGVVVNYIA